MTTSIAIASGKGGVGKTSIAVNLALTLCRLGSRTVLFDADFGLANSHILLGVNPKKLHKTYCFLKLQQRKPYLRDP